jgi:septal ring factor EnvC (AmiA/AmiB activator)
MKKTLHAGLALVAFAITSLAVLAQDQDKDQGTKPPAAGKGTETATQLANINADIAELKKQMGDIAELKKMQETVLRMLQGAAQNEQKNILQTQKNTSDLAALKERLEALEDKFNKLSTDRSTTVMDPALRDRLDRLEERLNRLGEGLTQIQRAGAGRVAPPAATVPMGQIQLTNLYWTPITVVVDGVAYTLMPNETRYLPKQAGNFTYEVLGVQASVLRALAAGETFTIRINR